MNLEYQAFGGTIFRPQPEVLIDKDLKIFSIITPWGPKHQTKNISDFLLQHYEHLHSDAEITSVFPKLASLSPEENALRNLILSCNAMIFKEQNLTQEYTFGYEMVCGVFVNNQILFAQIGHPFIYLNRPNISLQPLGHVLDLAGGFSKMDQDLPPLPSQLLGLHADTHFSIFKLPVQKDDQLIFISRNFVPGHLLELPQESRNLETISLELSKDNKDLPFWLGILKYS